VLCVFARIYLRQGEHGEGKGGQDVTNKSYLLVVENAGEGNTLCPVHDPVLRVHRSAILIRS